MKKITLLILFAATLLVATAQQKDSIQPRPLTMAEYDKAKTYQVKDLEAPM